MSAHILLLLLKGENQIKIVEIKKSARGKLDLTEAPVMITGGRAIHAAENYDSDSIGCHTAGSGSDEIVWTLNPYSRVQLPDFPPLIKWA